MSSADPTHQIQTLIDNAATEHIAIVAGLINPDVANSPTILYAGKDVWNTQHHQLTVTADTPFLLASITKTFTSSVQYLLRQNYGGNLGDFISVPGYPLSPGLAALPILDLANYSPGFPTDNQGSWLPKDKADTLESLIQYLSKATNLPQNSPGTCYSYSNFGWALLGLAALGITSLTDDVLAAWDKQIGVITTDFNLDNTRPYDSSIDPNLPVGYRQNGKIIPPGFSYGMKHAMLFGAGNLVSTPNDMLEYLAFNMGRTNTSPLLKMQQGQQWTMPKQCPPDAAKKVPTVGLAWFFQSAKANGQQVTWLTKNGGNAGFTSWMGFQQWVETEKASTIGAFVLTNSHQASPLGSQIIKILLGVSPTSKETEMETDYVTPD